MTSRARFGRRSFLAAIPAISAAGGGSTVSDRLCIALNPSLLLGEAPDQLRRFQRIGFGTLRAGVGRIGPDPDLSNPPWTNRIAFLQQAVRSGFRLKLQVASWSGTPDDFERRHPDAKIVNARGESPRPGYLSPWYPDLNELLMRETEAFFAVLRQADLLGAVDSLIADLGPAGEPIYPAAWILKGSSPHDATFWFYDEHAQAAFGPDMRRRFRDDLAAVNARWGTSFASWPEVRIPQPRSQPGLMWEDVLIWYRDAKRAVIRDQVAHCHAQIASNFVGTAAPQLVLLEPGSHLPPEEWRRAVVTGDGSYLVKLMVDNEFILDLAHQTGSAVQHTAAQNETEIRYLRDYMRGHSYVVPLLGENAMGGPAGDPGHLADVVVRNDLYGFDYIDAASALRSDGLTQLATACRRMMAHWPTRVTD